MVKVERGENGRRETLVTVGLWPLLVFLTMLGLAVIGYQHTVDAGQSAKLETLSSRFEGMVCLEQYRTDQGRLDKRLERLESKIDRIMSAVSAPDQLRGAP